MNAAARKVVTIEYTLKDDAGEILDSSEGGEPLVYLHGADNIVEGLEKAIEGKGAGDALKVSVAPEEGYGVREESLVQKLPVRKFPGGKVQVGQIFQADTEDGHRMLRITSVVGDYCTVDANHPLAGMNLHFDVKVVDVRDATAEELEHGHVHGGDGHHHH